MSSKKKTINKGSISTDNSLEALAKKISDSYFEEKAIEKKLKLGVWGSFKLWFSEIGLSKEEKQKKLKNRKIIAKYLLRNPLKFPK